MITWAMDSCIVCCGIISSRQSAATSEIVKALLATSFVSCKKCYSKFWTLPSPFARNKGGGTNLKVKVQIICKQNALHTTVQNFLCIFVNFCTLVPLHSLTFPRPVEFPLTFPDRRNDVFKRNKQYK